jgi:hypothetical protein
MSNEMKVKQVAKDPLKQETTETVVTIRAKRVNQIGMGDTYRVTLYTQPVAPIEYTMLARLFPHTEKIITQALQTEALLASIYPEYAAEEKQ